MYTKVYTEIGIRVGVRENPHSRENPWKKIPGRKSLEKIPGAKSWWRNPQEK
jgi:hypothetical protein